MMCDDIYYKYDKLLNSFCEDNHVVIRILDDYDNYYLYIEQDDKSVRKAINKRKWYDCLNKENMLNRILHDMYKKI